MKNLKQYIVLAAVVMTAFSLPSCKNKKAVTEESTMNSTIPADTIASAMQPAPVMISADDSLTRMATDAVKDFPGVTAAVMNGEVTLTGDIKRDNLKSLMSAVNAMHPKKINNNLTLNP